MFLRAFSGTGAIAPISWPSLPLPLLLRSLYILSILRITAVFISRRIGPVILISAIFKKGSPQQVTHLPWHRHSSTRNLGFTSHSRDEAIKVKWLAQGRVPWWILNPWWFGCCCCHFNIQSKPRQIREWCRRDLIKTDQDFYLWIYTYYSADPESIENIYFSIVLWLNFLI
jgi:hypothetical protein